MNFIKHANISQWTKSAFSGKYNVRIESKITQLYFWIQKPDALIFLSFSLAGQTLLIITRIQEFFSSWHMIYSHFDSEGLGISYSCLQQEEGI